MSKKPLLELDGITKRFGDVVANDDISFSVDKGEVHALLGENGAGKSTLMNILYGLYTPTEGTIRLNGESQTFRSPKDAITAGIGMVHQHFKLIPRMTVLENVVLGERETANATTGVVGKLAKLFGRERDEPRVRLNELADQYGLEVDPDAKVWELDVGEQQRVEILKTLYKDIDLLILDEPTAVLTPDESEQLFETIRTLVDEGLTVIFISHKLWEIEQLADRVTVLRDGKRIDTVDVDSVARGELAELMVGREVLFDVDKKQVSAGDAVLEATNLHANDDRGLAALTDVDITVAEQEVVGIAGVSGNGQRELAECLIGYRPLTDGSVVVDGTDLTGSPPKRIIDSGVSFIPEDRYAHGCAAELSIMHNSATKVYRNGELKNSRLFLDYPGMADYAEEIVDGFDVRGVTNVTQTPAGTLSGGNLQKLILGREMSRSPTLLIANQPTRGVDVGAIEHIRERMLEQQRAGTGVVLISEDLDELLDLSDRILVLYDGQVVHETTPAETNKWELGIYMSTGSAPVEGDRTPAQEAQ